MEMHNFFKEGPLHPIIGFSHVNLDDHKCIVTFPITHIMHDFMVNNSVIYDISIWDKCSLSKGDDFI